MQKMMNDTAELITENNNGDILPVVLNEEVQFDEQEKSEVDKLKEELSSVTYDEILNSTAPYEKILTLPDEFAVSQYITAFRQVAKKFKLTADFDSLVAPYREKALRQLKEAVHQEKKEEKSKYPKWWDGTQVNEDVFCTELLAQHTLYCINGLFYDIDGEFLISELSKVIYERIKPYVVKNVADRTKRLVEAMKIKCYHPAPECNNIIPFMESEHDFKFDASGQIHSQELYWAYQSWCRLNNLDELSRRTFSGYLKSHADDYGITYSENAVNEQGKRARGFIGIRYTYRPPNIMY